MNQNSVLLAAVSAALFLSSCTPNKQVTDAQHADASPYDASPDPSASPVSDTIYVYGGGYYVYHGGYYYPYSYSAGGYYGRASRTLRDAMDEQAQADRNPSSPARNLNRQGPAVQTEDGGTDLHSGSTAGAAAAGAAAGAASRGSSASSSSSESTETESTEGESDSAAHGEAEGGEAHGGFGGAGMAGGGG